MTEKTSFITEDKTFHENGAVSVRVRYLRSTRSDKTTDAHEGYTAEQVRNMSRQELIGLVSEHSAVATDEIPNILNTIKKSGHIDSVSEHFNFDDLFDYVFDEDDVVYTEFDYNFDLVFSYDDGMGFGSGFGFVFL